MVVILDDMWPNPLQYFLVPDIEVETEGNEEQSAEECEDDEQMNDETVGEGKYLHPNT